MENRDSIRKTAAKAKYLDTVVLPAMDALRTVIDNIEESISREHYPFPTYDDMFMAM